MVTDFCFAKCFVTVMRAARSSINRSALTFRANPNKKDKLMKSRIIALTIAGALTLGTLGVYAHEGGGHGGHRFKHGKMALEHLTKDLDLTPQQQAQVAPIIDQAKPQIMAIHQEAMQKTRAVMENAGGQIRPLLTPQQQVKFDAVKKAHEDMLNAMKDLHAAKMQ